MQVTRFPSPAQAAAIIRRPVTDLRALEAQVMPVIEGVQAEGDRALRKFTRQFDGVDVATPDIPEHIIQQGLRSIDGELLEAIRVASANIAAFHRQQLAPIEKVETSPGVVCWRKSVAIQKVGLYIPGGSAPLFSTLLMLAIPAMIAGCPEIVVCTPPGRNGEVHPATLAAAAYLGIHSIYKVGGVQAIAAMAFGTETIPAVNKIFGPGNQFVTAAKQQVQRWGVAIDMPAGPSEVAVFADRTANAAFVAADLLSQAEHGPDSQVLLVTDHEPLIGEVQLALARQLDALPRMAQAGAALNHSHIVLVGDAAEAMKLLNRYAPEHLILSCEDAASVAGLVVNAGSVFLGHYSPESAGDYASGTNHTLPTNGYAHAYSGVSVDSFVKKITFQELSLDGLRGIGAAVQHMALAEGLTAHAEAVRIRLETKQPS